MAKVKITIQAEELGFTKFHMATLYARPNIINIRQRVLTRYVPDVIGIVRNYLLQNDPSVLEEMVGTRELTAYYLSLKLYLYAEITDKTTFWTIMNPAKHALQINIFCNDEFHVRGIANAVNKIFYDGMLIHMDWKFVEKKWQVKREDCIASWKKFL